MAKLHTPARRGPAHFPKVRLRSWLSDVPKTWRHDLTAGATLWGLAVPQAIAYAGLAGLGPTAGIWAVVIMLVVYAVWGSSRRLVSTPLSSAAVTMASIIAAFGTGVAPEQAAATISITVGIVFLLAYGFRLGGVVNYISLPILSGFTFGLTIQIIVSQANKLFGVPGTDGHVITRIIGLIGHLKDTNWVTVGLSIIAFAVMLGLPRLNRAIPAGLIMIVMTTALVAIFHLDTSFGVDVPGSIPTGLPHLVTPTLTGIEPMVLIIGSIGIVLLALSEASSVGREVSSEDGMGYRLDSDLFPWGLGNILSGSVGGVVSSGSMSTSLANVAAGARTQLATVITAILAMVTVIFFGDAVALLPQAALAVLIIVSVWSHLSLKFLYRKAEYSRSEAVISIIAALGVVLFGILNGLVIAMVISLIWFFRRSTKIGYWDVGQSVDDADAIVREGSPGYQPPPDHVLVLRFAGQLFYGNVHQALELVERGVIGHGSIEAPERDGVVIDLDAQLFLDYTTVETLVHFADQVDTIGVRLVLVGIRDSLADDIQAALKFADARVPSNTALRCSTQLSPVLAALQRHELPASDIAPTTAADKN